MNSGDRVIWLKYSGWKIVKVRRIEEFHAIIDLDDSAFIIRPSHLYPIPAGLNDDQLNNYALSLWRISR